MIRSVEPAQNHVYLTFDDGPDPVGTKATLDVLEKYNFHATFFVIANKAKQFPELVRDIVARGHTLGNHSLDHRYSHYFKSTASVQLWIQESEDTIRDVSGVATVGFRPPAGICAPPVIWACASLKMPLILWKHRCYDSLWGFSPGKAEAMASRIRGGDIVLLHDSQRVQFQRQYKDALNKLCSEMSRRGLNSKALLNLGST